MAPRECDRSECAELLRWFYDRARGELGHRAAPIEPGGGGLVDPEPSDRVLRVAARYNAISRALALIPRADVGVIELAFRPVPAFRLREMDALGARLGVKAPEVTAYATAVISPTLIFDLDPAEPKAGALHRSIVAYAEHRIKKALKAFCKARAQVEVGNV